MSSQRRIKASQRNGALSRGPKTAAGKARSSQNAVRHGLLAKRVVLSNESEENFLIVMDQYVDRLDPQDGVEYGFVEEMVACYWRLHRSMAIEKGLFDQALRKHATGLQIDRAADAWTELAAGDALKTLHRYQASLHRNFQRSMNNLLLLRDIGPKNIEARNEPNPNSGHSEEPVSEPSGNAASPAGGPQAKPQPPASVHACKQHQDAAPAPAELPTRLPPGSHPAVPTGIRRPPAS